MITVNKFVQLWLHYSDPDSDVKIWDRKSGDYIFSTKYPLPGQGDKANEISAMEVKCFYEYYDDTGESTLIINVGEYK